MYPAPEFVAGIETRSHLGGTITLFKGLPDDVSPYFLLLKHETGGMYFMSILDLKSVCSRPGVSDGVTASTASRSSRRHHGPTAPG